MGSLNETITNLDEKNKKNEKKKPLPLSLGPLFLEQTKATRAPLVHTHSPYYSKLYTSNINVNSLLAAASPIFTLLGRVRILPQYTNPNELYLDFVHEIKAFESYAQRLNYRAENILVARYLLASTVDEVILNTHWGKESEWREHNLLMFFQQEDWGGNRFFVILERLEEEPLFYIDVL